MKEKELRDSAICIVCKRPFGHTGLPLFRRLTIERFGVDAQAVQRQDGLAAMLGGSPVLASIMGPNEDLTKPMMDAVVVTICEDCAVKPLVIGLLAEAASKDKAG